MKYGAETRPMTKTFEEKVNAFEMWCYRRISGTSWKEKKTNIEVCQKIGTTPSLLKKIATAALKYYGHIERHHNILKEILDGRIEGRRSRGRQRNMWTDNIKRWANKSKMQECTTAAQDRLVWRNISRQPQMMGGH